MSNRHRRPQPPRSLPLTCEYSRTNPDARPDRHRTKPGCSPDATRFSALRFSLRRRRKGWCLPRNLRFPPCPWLPFFNHIFSWLEATQERRGSRVKPARSPARRLSGRSAAQRLDSASRAPYTLQRKNGRLPPAPSFQHVYRREPRGCCTATRSRGFSFWAACFLQVRARERGNRPFFALLPPSSLIPCTLTRVNPKLLCSSHSGVTCPYPTRCKAAPAFLSPSAPHLRQAGHPNPRLPGT